MALTLYVVDDFLGYRRGDRITDPSLITSIRAGEYAPNVVLVGDGRRIKPLAWEGEGIGGKHRAGVLKFIAIKPRPKEMQLQMTRPGEARPRIFRFAFGDWSA